ncbi:PilW family protein [Psychrobacter glacincola]|uniref:PilW family protein n=1 Tax=Psychrobacter glacincola TaxID=56810 RepID=A0ABW1W5W8_9GAMM|nr:PilW family protein [Psychrobacter glacincola]
MSDVSNNKYSNKKHLSSEYFRHHSAIAGFTLIELMISLVLGLLISAAVIQVYIINTRTITVQQSASEVQDSSIFALQTIEDNVRLSNLGNPVTAINSTIKHGGIVLTGSNIGNSSYANTGYLTVSAGQTGTVGDKGWTGLSNTNTNSDQLTIQYKNITSNDVNDCEGTKVDSGSTEWVVERYFVRLATNASTTPALKDLVLACDAGRVTATDTLVDFGGNGEVMIAAVDQFKVLLGVQTDISNLTYITPKTYLELTDKPPITTVKLGVIIRSTTPLLTDADRVSFTVLGVTNTLKADATRTKYYRRSYESTVLLRNARVMNIVATQPKLVSTTTAPGGG